MGLRQGSTSLFNGEWLDLAPPLFLSRIDLVFEPVLTPSSWLFVVVVGLVRACMVGDSQGCRSSSLLSNDSFITVEGACDWCASQTWGTTNRTSLRRRWHPSCNRSMGLWPALRFQCSALRQTEIKKTPIVSIYIRNTLLCQFVDCSQWHWIF